MNFDFVEGEVLLVDKEPGWTSFDVVKSLRNSILKQVKQKKIKVGHAGTLDPLATGLLIICTGRKTKEIDRYQGADKVYEGIISLGSYRPSYDMETEVQRYHDTSAISPERIRAVAATFVGEQEQVPPMFSAVKVNGLRAYQLAREDKEVPLKKRKITIHTFDITTIEGTDVHFKIRCSKGTYIRSIARDFGLALDTEAYLKALRRTAIGDFSVENALKVEQIKKMIQAMGAAGEANAD